MYSFITEVPFIVHTDVQQTEAKVGIPSDTLFTVPAIPSDTLLTVPAAGFTAPRSLCINLNPGRFFFCILCYKLKKTSLNFPFRRMHQENNEHEGYMEGYFTSLE